MVVCARAGDELLRFVGNDVPRLTRLYDDVIAEIWSRIPKGQMRLRRAGLGAGDRHLEGVAPVAAEGSENKALLIIYANHVFRIIQNSDAS